MDSIPRQLDRKAPRLIPRFAVSILLLAVALYIVGPAQMVAALENVKPLWLAGVVAFQVIGLVVGSLGIWALVCTFQRSVRFGVVAPIYFRTTALGMFAPGKLGELVFPHFLTKRGVPFGSGLAVLVVDKLITFVCAAAIGCIGLLTLVGARQALGVATLSALLVSLVLLAAANERARRFVRKRLLGRYRQKFEGFNTALFGLLQHEPVAVGVNTILTVGRFFVRGAAAFSAFHALGLPVPYFPTVAILCLIQILSWVPISLSGLGVAQGSAILLFTLLLNADQAVVLNVFLILPLTAYLIAAVMLGVLGVRD